MSFNSAFKFYRGKCLSFTRNVLVLACRSKIFYQVLSFFTRSNSSIKWHSTKPSLPRLSSDFSFTNEVLCFIRGKPFKDAIPIYWSWYEPRNFGDWISPFLYESIHNQRPIYCPRKCIQDQDCIMIAGSTLNQIRYPNKVIVWGTGIINSVDNFAMPKRVFAVRGPLTRKRMIELGYECPETYGDPAVLIPYYLKSNLKTAPKQHNFGYIPHFVDYCNLHFCKDCLLINPTLPVQQVAQLIASCKIVFTSSLHGLIVSHSLGVPAVWLSSRNQLDGDGVKFLDYFMSVHLDVAPSSLDFVDLTAFAELASRATLPCQKHLVLNLVNSCPWPVDIKF